MLSNWWQLCSKPFTTPTQPTLKKINCNSPFLIPPVPKRKAINLMLMCLFSTPFKSNTDLLGNYDAGTTKMHPHICLLQKHHAFETGYKTPCRCTIMWARYTTMPQALYDCYLALNYCQPAHIVHQH